jgi:hypothetical protein
LAKWKCQIKELNLNNQRRKQKPDLDVLAVAKRYGCPYKEANQRVLIHDATTQNTGWRNHPIYIDDGDSHGFRPN